MRKLQLLFAASSLICGNAALAADGAALYKANCSGCHGVDGKADSAAAKAMKVPALAGTSLSPEAVVAKLKGSPRHAGLAGKLSDEELLAIARALPGR
ncbi:MAG TPA: cytochrome c [Myxococcota bacterium]|nr:cytochrome c [Myxococcota bacterium]